MKGIFLFITAFFTVWVASAQSAQGDLAATLGVTTVPNFNNQSTGFDMSVRYYFTDNFSAGGSFYFSKSKFNHGFGYDTDRTLINKYSITIPFQYDLVQMENLSVGLGFSTGVLVNELRNRRETTEEEYWDDSSGIGMTWRVPAFLKNNTFFTATPFAEASYKILSIDTADPTFLYVTAKIGYQNVFGNGSFSKASDFSDTIFSFGLTIKGPTD